MTGRPAIPAAAPRVALLVETSLSSGRDILLGRGLRHFAYFGLTGENWSDERRAAFLAFLRAHGLDAAALGLTRRRLEQRPWNTVVREIAGWVSALPLPCGVMLCSDERGLIFQEACRRADRAIGEQIAVVGVGNDRPMCELLRPALSSVEADHERVGYEAAALLDRLMRGEKPSSLSARIAPLRVVVRASSDVLAVPDAVVNRAVSFIRRQACGGIGVEDVARHAAVSRSVLQWRFRALLRHTVHDEIVHARLRRSIELLGQTDLPVEEVAEQTGFGYAKNLRQALRDRFDRAPGDYRRRPASNTPPPDSRGAERKGPVAP